VKKLHLVGKKLHSPLKTLDFTIVLARLKIGKKGLKIASKRVAKFRFLRKKKNHG
jgi:hypothetical protein